jgi:hypothetical protein
LFQPSVLDHDGYQETGIMKTARDRIDPQRSTGPDDLGVGDTTLDAASARADDARAAADAFVRCWPTSPFRALDWRWRLAGLIRDGHPGPRRSGDDPWLRAALRLGARVEPRAGDPRRRRTRQDGFLDVAYRLRIGDDRRRWEVEARLLAGQDDPAIADRAGVPSDVVAAYASLFFDVRGRLGSTDWVAATVFGRRLYEGPVADDVELVWKVFAYRLGPLALDALVGRPLDAPEAPSAGDRAGASMADRLAMAVAAMTLRVDEESAPKLIRLAARVREVEREAASRAAGPAFGPIGLAGQHRGGVGPGVDPGGPVPSSMAGGLAGLGVPGDFDEGDREPAIATPLAFPAGAFEVVAALGRTG